MSTVKGLAKKARKQAVKEQSQRSSRELHQKSSLKLSYPGPPGRRGQYKITPVICGPHGPVYSSSHRRVVLPDAGPSDQMFNMSLFDPHLHFDNPNPIAQPAISRSARKKQAQHRCWDQRVLPRLIRPFLRSRRSRLEAPLVDLQADNRECICGEPGITLPILAVYQNCTSVIEVQSCSCHLAAERLVEQGLFPCAPLAPSLAVSLDVLEFACDLYLHFAPNDRAFVGSLRKFLQARGYSFDTEVS